MMYVHVQRLMAVYTGVIPPFVGQDYFCDTGSRYNYQNRIYIPMTLSGMAMAVVHEAPVEASTPHHGSASNSLSLHMTTLKSGFVVTRALIMKCFNELHVQ